MKSAIFLLLLSSLSLLADEPWPGVPYTEVRAYAWPNDKSTDAVILHDMSLKPGVINKGGALLTPPQVKTLLAAVTGQHKKYTSARCYLPHNALVFYNAEKKPVAFVEICFTCLNHKTRPGDAAKSIDFPALASLFDAHKLPMGGYRSAAAFNKIFERASDDQPKADKAK